MELVEKSLPRGEGGQGQRRRTRVVQRARLRSNDAFVHELQLSVGAGTLQCSGVVDVIAGLEEGGLLADRDDRSRCIPSQDAFLAAGVVEGGAHFDVNGVDGQCLDLHEDVVASGSRRGGDGGIDQGIRDVHRASGSSDDSGHGALGVRAA